MVPGFRLQMPSTAKVGCRIFVQRQMKSVIEVVALRTQSPIQIELSG